MLKKNWALFAGLVVILAVCVVSLFNQSKSSVTSVLKNIDNVGAEISEGLESTDGSKGNGAGIPSNTNKATTSVALKTQTEVNVNNPVTKISSSAAEPDKLQANPEVIKPELIKDQIEQSQVEEKKSEHEINSKVIAASVFAGSGKIGVNGGKSSEAEFNLPYGLTADKSGNLIVVDSYNNMIRKIKDGVVTTIAGSPENKDKFGFPLGGYVDDTAGEAKFNMPRDAVIDSKGNIFVSDTGNNVIRKIANDRVYTFAGSGEKGYKDGKGTSAKFNSPSGLSVDKDDNLYVADKLNNVIRKITPSGEVSTFAGRFNADGGFYDGPVDRTLFNEPEDVAVDKNGTVYVLDTANQSVRKIERGKVSTLAGFRGDVISGTNYIEGGYSDGPGDKAIFNFPKGFCITSEGIIFVADTWNHRIRAIKPDNEVVTVAGSGIPGKKEGKPEEMEFNGPVGILYNKGVLYISDMRNNCIRTVDVDIKDYRN